MSHHNEFIVVMTNMPDEKSAKSLADKLISQRLAACVNILAPCQSVYQWQDKIEHAIETPVMIKSRQAHAAAIENMIQSMHPYELPEIIHLKVDGGSPAYLQWLFEETSL